MTFDELRDEIRRCSNDMPFKAASDALEELIFGLKRRDFLPLVVEIGIIPEDIPHDSTEEKLYAKCADIVLAKSFMELGLNATVNRERANCADVVARSTVHDYSLVGDAKAFRLSRTAKNQKDFKVKSMVDWRGDHDYAVLVCPYYQYPSSTSQIFGQALTGNILLFSWEHLALLMEQSVEECPSLNLGKIWNLSKKMSRSILTDDRDRSFVARQDRSICKMIGLPEERFSETFSRYRGNMASRCRNEIRYWEGRKRDVLALSRDEAVAQLVAALKLDEKISSIRNFLMSMEA